MALQAAQPAGTTPEGPAFTLADALTALEAELATQESYLGLDDQVMAQDAEKEPSYSNIPRRVEQHITNLLVLVKRSSQITVAVREIKALVS